MAFIPNDDDLIDWTKHRKCFPYSDGTQDLGGDPMEIIERMNVFSGGSPNKVIEQTWPMAEPVIIAMKDPETGDLGQGQKVDDDGNPLFYRPQASLEAVERFYAMICFAFEVQAWDKVQQTGLTRGMLYSLWQSFHEWLDQKKTPSDSKPTSSAPTGAESAPSSLPA